jgi:hypothetical protein
VPLDKRSRILIATAAVVAVAVAAMMFVPSPAGGSQTITMYKSPTCGCCGDWADQMAARGFDIDNNLTVNMAAVFAEHGIPPEFQSCHLAVVGDYVVVGHVPPAEVIRLLQSGEPVKGLTAPGMPAGSPGMEMPNGRADPYQVLVLDKDGGVRPLARYQGDTRLD